MLRSSGRIARLRGATVAHVRSRPSCFLDRRARACPVAWHAMRDGSLPEMHRCAAAAAPADRMGDPILSLRTGRPSLQGIRARSHDNIPPSRGGSRRSPGHVCLLLPSRRTVASAELAHCRDAGARLSTGDGATSETFSSARPMRTPPSSKIEAENRAHSRAYLAFFTPTASPHPGARAFGMGMVVLERISACDRSAAMSHTRGESAPVAMRLLRAALVRRVRAPYRVRRAHEHDAGRRPLRDVSRARLGSPPTSRSSRTDRQRGGASKLRTALIVPRINPAPQPRKRAPRPYTIWSVLSEPRTDAGRTLQARHKRSTATTIGDR